MLLLTQEADRPIPEPRWRNCDIDCKADAFESVPQALLAQPLLTWMPWQDAEQSSAEYQSAS